MLEIGKTYYFWDNTRERLGSLEITDLQEDHFYFSYLEIEKPGRGTYPGKKGKHRNFNRPYKAPDVRFVWRCY